MKPKILLIEDHAQNRYLATYLLEHAGFDVVAAESGAAGLAMAQDHAPDLILLDIQLPDMDGYQIASALRSTPAHRTTPIVALSSFAMPGDRDKASAAGCTAYIEKPIDPDTFARQIHALLNLQPKA